MSEPACDNGQTCECEPLFQVDPPNPPPPPIVFYNTIQCATAKCPTAQFGADTTVCKAAGLFSSTVSQEDADNQAYAAALAEANGQLNCGIAGQLEGLRWEMACTNGSNPCSCVDPSDHSVVMQGVPGQTYTVFARIRGLVECKNYAFYGVLGVGSGHLFTCTNPTQAVPAAPANPANEYSLSISDPAATYFLNRLLPPGINPTLSEIVDYTFTFQVKTGAVVLLKARAIDALQFKNISNLVVNNAPPPIGIAEPFNGQFITMTIDGVI